MPLAPSRPASLAVALAAIVARGVWGSLRGAAEPPADGSAAVAAAGTGVQSAARWGGVRVQGPDAESYKVCGNYCGPGWCDDRWVHEGSCHADVAPTGCSDACCKVHDVCCGDGAQGRSNPTPFGQCNTVLLQCLQGCGSDLSCHNGLLPVPASLIEAGMSIVQDWCCGGPCDAGALLSAFAATNATAGGAP